MIELYDECILKDLMSILNPDTQSSGVVDIIGQRKQINVFGPEQVDDFVKQVKTSSAIFPAVALTRGKNCCTPAQERTNNDVASVNIAYSLTIITTDDREQRSIKNVISDNYIPKKRLIIKQPKDSGKEIDFYVEYILKTYEIGSIDVSYVESGKLYQQILEVVALDCLLPSTDESANKSIEKKTMRNKSHELQILESIIQCFSEINRFTNDGKEIIKVVISRKDDYGNDVDEDYSGTFTTHSKDEEIFPTEELTLASETIKTGKVMSPTKEIIERDYPEPIVNTPDGFLTAMSEKRTARREAELAWAKSTPEWQAYIVEMDAYYDALEAQAENAYQLAMQNYNDVGLKQNANYDAAKKLLSEHYTCVKEYVAKMEFEKDRLLFEANIPVTLHRLSSIKSLHNIMKESDYDIESAIKLCEMQQERDQQKSNEWRENIDNVFYGMESQPYQDDYYSEPSQGSSGGGFLSGMLQSAAGTAIGTSGTRKELRRQTEMMEDQERERKRRADDDRYYERNRNNQMRSEIIRQNQERRRKGLPDLPVPPGDYRY